MSDVMHDAASRVSKSGGVQIAVIGAGLAGLMAAREIAARGGTATVFEKSRAPGGRAATRHHGDRHFDHGAQYFTQRDVRLAERLGEWERAGVVAPWTARVVAVTGGDITPVSDTPVRWVAMPGMRALGVHLAQSLTVHYATTIRAIERDGSAWRLRDDTGMARGTYDQVLVTTPAPQAHALLAPHAPSFLDALAAVPMHPCVALMVELATRPGVPWDAAFVNDHAVLSWVARNASKPGRAEHECWVVHASAAWSQVHLEHDPPALVPELLQAFGGVLGAPVHAVQATAHRWRYAIPGARDATRAGEAWYDARLGVGVGGDWCLGGRVEGALLSGLALGTLVAS